MKKLLFAAAIIAALIWGLWLVAVPEDLLVNVIKDSAGKADLGVEVTGFRKGLFYNFTIEVLDIKRSDKTLLSIDDLSARIDLLSLPLMKAVMLFQGSLGSGKLKGEAILKRKHYEINTNVDRAEIDRLGFFKYTGIKGKGILKADLHVEDGLGEIKFSIDDAELEALSYSGFKFSLNMFRSAKGIVCFKRNTVEIESFSLEGKGIYARAKGTVRGGKLDIKLELMPEEALLPEKASIVLSLIQRYKVSPGYYVIPVKGSYDAIFHPN